MKKTKRNAFLIIVKTKTHFIENGRTKSRVLKKTGGPNHVCLRKREKQNTQESYRKRETKTLSIENGKNINSFLDQNSHYKDIGIGGSVPFLSLLRRS